MPLFAPVTAAILAILYVVRSEITSLMWLRPEKIVDFIAGDRLMARPLWISNQRLLATMIGEETIFSKFVGSPQVRKELGHEIELSQFGLLN